MKKTKTIGLSILTVFLLCSISYNPIAAEKQVIEIKENIEIGDEEDCECDSKENNNYSPIFICLTLWIKMYIFMRLFLYFEYTPTGLYFLSSFFKIYSRFQDLNCLDLIPKMII
jgi:hypothetical protein